MTRTRDGLAQTVFASDSQVTYYAAQGYILADGVPPVRYRLVRDLAVINGVLTVTYDTGDVVELTGVAGGSGGAFVIDTDGVPYLGTPGQAGARGYGYDTDGVPYLLPAAS